MTTTTIIDHLGNLSEVSQKMFNDLKHKIDLEFITKVEWEDK